MFVNEINLWQVIQGFEDQKAFQNNQHQLQTRSDKWLLDFNIQNCVVLRLNPTNCHSNDNTRTSHLNDITLPAESLQKDLGVWIRSKLADRVVDWRSQVVNYVAGDHPVPPR
ncbi:hypothetical protein SprV_0802638600 [Sparganum proliferum]